jgi:hypothetical protein
LTALFTAVIPLGIISTTVDEATHFLLF